MSIVDPHAPEPSGHSLWHDPAREAAFRNWLSTLAASQGLDAGSVRLASADASFRRYLRIDSTSGSRIIMDAPPLKEDCRPFVQVAQLMQQAGLLAPQVLAWDEPNGFMLLSDLGTQTMMQAIDPAQPQAHLGLYLQAVESLVAWQSASKPDVLPPYDQALLQRELGLFPEWYLGRHRGLTLDGAQQSTLDAAFATIMAQHLAWLQPQHLHMARCLRRQPQQGIGLQGRRAIKTGHGRQ